MTTTLAFPHAWRAEVLTTPPLIAPARQFTYPRAIAGEEDALARGALQLLIHPQSDAGENAGVPHSSTASSSMSGMNSENAGVPHSSTALSSMSGMNSENAGVPHSSTASSSMSGMNNASPFLATCALGFTDPSMPTGLYSCPNPQELCAVAGGYAYVIDTSAPERSTHIPLRPVVEVLSVPPAPQSESPFLASGLLLFAGFHSILAWGGEGLAWQTARLTWEGLRITGVHNGEDGVPRLHGLGWNMHTDKEVEFAVDLRTGAHTGGGY